MRVILDVGSIKFRPATDRVEGIVTHIDHCGRLTRHRLSAVAHPTWGLPKMARALDRAARLRLDK